MCHYPSYIIVHLSCMTTLNMQRIKMLIAIPFFKHSVMVKAVINYNQSGVCEYSLLWTSFFNQKCQYLSAIQSRVSVTPVVYLECTNWKENNPEFNSWIFYDLSTANSYCLQKRYFGSTFYITTVWDSSVQMDSVKTQI